MNTLETVVTILVLITGLEVRVRRLTKHYLDELKPNGGNSIKDQISRLEKRLDDMILHLINKQ